MYQVHLPMRSVHICKIGVEEDNGNDEMDDGGDDYDDDMGEEERGSCLYLLHLPRENLKSYIEEEYFSNFVRSDQQSRMHYIISASIKNA